MQTATHVHNHGVKAACKYLQDTYGITYMPSTLNRLRCVGGGPGFRRVGRTILYPQDQLDVWANFKLGDVLTSTSAAKTGKVA